MESKPTKRKESKSKEKVNKVRKLSLVDQKQIKLMEDIECEMLMEKELKQTAKVQDAKETYCTNLACCWILILPLLRFIDVIEIEVVDIKKSSCWIS